MFEVISNFFEGSECFDKFFNCMGVTLSPREGIFLVNALAGGLNQNVIC